MGSQLDRLGGRIEICVTGLLAEVWETVLMQLLRFELLTKDQF